MSTPGSPAKKSQRNNWSNAETEILLSMLKERDIINKMDGKEFKHAQLRQIFTEDLRKHGCNRTCGQIKTRLKTLRDKYNSIKSQREKSGGGGKIEWEYYADMHELYGCRPFANRKGVDSGKLAIAKFQKPAIRIPIKAASIQRPALEEIELNTFVDPESSTKDISEAVVTDPSVDQEDELEDADYNQMCIRPLPSKEGIFVMRSVMVTSPDTIEEGIDDLSTTEMLGDGSKTEVIQKERVYEIEESEKQERAEDEEASEKQERKKQKQTFEESSKEILQSFDAKRAATIETLHEYQKKVQAQGITELDQAMQKNALLIIQAFAMAQNSQQNSSQCNCRQNKQPLCSSSQNQPSQTSSYQNTPQFNFSQEAGTPIGVPHSFLYPLNPFCFPGQTSMPYYASPFVPNFQNFNYLGQSIPGGFSVPAMPSVPNFFLLPEQMAETVCSSEKLANAYNENPFDAGSNPTVSVEEKSAESLQENAEENLQEDPIVECTNSPQPAVDAFLLEKNPKENFEEIE